MVIIVLHKKQPVLAMNKMTKAKLSATAYISPQAKLSKEAALKIGTD